MVFQMVFVFGDKRTFRTIEHFFRFYVHFGMSPKIFFCHGDKFTLFTFEHFDFALGVNFGYPDTLVVVQIFGGQIVLVLQVGFVFGLRFGVKITFWAPEIL